MFYKFEEIDDYFKNFDVDSFKIIHERKYNRNTHEREQVEYYNIVATFDTESTSCYKKLDSGETLKAKDVASLREEQGLKFDESNYRKLGFTYIWMFLIDGHIIIGRTWEEYKEFIKRLVKEFKLSITRRLICYVHNLSFDYQFYRKEFEWENVFATEKRKLIYALDTNGIEYKCSYFLSNSSLEEVGKHLQKYKAEKKVGDLDYDLIRTYKTPMTDKEIEYCLNDVIVVYNYIRECMENEANGLITDIVLTNTGRVRKDCKQYCLSKEYYSEYHKIISEMYLNPELYKHEKLAFSGGFTHANALNCMTTIKNVFSVDFTSSYPATLLLNKFPMGKPNFIKPKNSQQFREFIKARACLFTIEYKNIRLKDIYNDSLISESKCLKKVNCVVNNGRIESADLIQTVITEVDFKAFEKFYDYDGFSIGYFVSWRKDYLPKPLLECILKYYKLKTELKGNDDETARYQLLKGMLNSTFGMMVTDIFRDVILYDDKCGWKIEKGNIEECIEHYNKSKNRFLSFEWGIWCCSISRYKLYSGLAELKSDFIYADTDSLKFTNYENHIAYFKRYNEEYIPTLIKRVCKARGLNEEDFSPKGKTIGVWDLETKVPYDEFRTLGAKRYLVKYNEQDEHYKKFKDVDGYCITVSGINKKVALPYLYEEAKKENVEMSDIFNDELYVDGEHSGKLLHSYIDYPIDEEITDYLGITARVTQKTAVHLEPSSYAIGDSIHDYMDYVRGIKNKFEKGSF